MSTDLEDIFVATGDRLKEERERLGFSQADFAAIAAAHRKSQGNYESGDRSPDATYLAAIAAAGADVQYIVTGVRSDVALTPDERVLLDRYRASPQPLRDAALRVLLGGDAPASTGSTTRVEQQIGVNLGGSVTRSGDIHVGGRKARK